MAGRCRGLSRRRCWFACVGGRSRGVVELPLLLYIVLYTTVCALKRLIEAKCLRAALKLMCPVMFGFCGYVPDRMDSPCVVR